MLKFEKLFTCIALIAIFIASPVFATEDSVTAVPVGNNDLEATSIESSTVTSTEDLFVNNSDNYTLDNILNANAFISTNNFTITSRNNGGIVSGDIFASTTNTTIESDLVYSDTKDKIGNYLIDSVKSKSVINGNVYIIATETFTLESKSEIHGDLYVLATTVNLEADSVVDGNVFVFANSTLNLNGKVSGSVYGITGTCNMNYTGHVAKDLTLKVDTANISGTVNRTTKITSDSGKVTLTSDFITSRDLKVEANDFEFAGEVQGNSEISAKALTFNTGKTCIIRGNLDYATNTEMEIPEGVVLGETKSSNYVDTNSVSYTILEKIISLVGFLIYVFAVALIFKRIAPNFIEKLSDITTTNIFIGLGVGFGLCLVALPLLILLACIQFTLSAAFVLLLALAFVIAISVPLFILAIANAWKLEKINVYWRILIIAAITYLVTLIPTVGTVAMVLFIIISVGRILTTLFYKKSQN